MSRVNNERDVSSSSAGPSRLRAASVTRNNHPQDGTGPTPGASTTTTMTAATGTATGSTSKAKSNTAPEEPGHAPPSTTSTPSAAAHALSNLTARTASGSGSGPASTSAAGTTGTVKRPKLVSTHTRTSSWPSPPPPVVAEPLTQTSISALPNKPTFSDDGEAQYPPEEPDSHRLLLYTYKPSSTSLAGAQPSPLPSRSSVNIIAPSTVLLCHAALPWKINVGDYLEIRPIKRESHGQDHGMGMGGSAPGPAPDEVRGGEALRGLKRNQGHDGFVFRVGDDNLHIPTNQIHVPESVASAFDLKLRSEVEIVRVKDPREASIDYVELRFSQYLGRGDMWRLGMSLESSTIHVGERITLCGGAVRAEIHGIWRGSHRYASGIFTSKTKTIYRSRSAQVYIFIQLCQEIWEFDEDGERYSEKVVHGFLPELFARWGARSTSHLVTVIFFARIYYDPEELDFMEQHDLTTGLIKDYAGRSCKDFFRVAIDFERRSDWNIALSEIKRSLERCEREILLDCHLAKSGDKTRILGRWSFAYEGNVLESVNLALNPFDEHYIDRDLTRTGLNMTVITPGTGHFAVDKNLLRLTTERMIDHGIGLDLVCLTKMPLHSVPLFSYVSQRPKYKGPTTLKVQAQIAAQSATPDLLYFDAHLSSAVDTELADCYSIPKWVNASFYSKTHDKPFRKDRFVPRCKMYDIQMLGILDHNLTTVTVPFLEVNDVPRSGSNATTKENRQKIRDAHDSNLFKPPGQANETVTSTAPVISGSSLATSFPAGTSYQSARLKEIRSESERSVSASSGAGSGSAGGESASKELSKSLGLNRGLGISPHKRSPLGRMRDMPPFEPLDLQRTELRATSPAPSSLSMGLSARAMSPPPGATRSDLPSIGSGFTSTDTQSASGQSTPRTTPSKKLNTKSSKSSFASRFGVNFLLGTFTGRSQMSFPTAATETIGRQDVSSVTGSKLNSPVSASTSPSVPRAVPGAPIITPSTPSPAKEFHQTQPLPIRRARIASDEEAQQQKSQKNSLKASRSPGDSWQRAAAFQRGKSHVAVNPCNPRENIDASLADFKRWQHLRPKTGTGGHKETQHLVKWTSLTVPACLPLTTDFMPTTSEIQEYYEFNSYDIACYPDQVSFLVRTDAARVNLPLAVMREMASQRLSQNFQFIVLPHQSAMSTAEEDDKPTATRRLLLPGDSTTVGLRVGGASEVLRDAEGAIHLLWANHIHRLAFDATKQSVTVQRFVRKLSHEKQPVHYRCLVRPSQTNAYQEAEATFRYPNVEAKLNFNYLDRLIAGEEDQLTSSLRYWRTRYLLLPSGKDPLSIQGVVPKGESFDPSEILISGAFKVLEILGRNQWTRPGQPSKRLRLLPTTFDPSACILDDGLMTELDRLHKAEERVDMGKALAGLTLQDVAEMMCQPNNGLVIRDRWWNMNFHEDSFTGEQFCEWLQGTFTDVRNQDEAAEWGKSLFDKGLIEHVTAQHGFVNYGHFFYRLREAYDPNARKRKKVKSSWFGGSGKQAQESKDNQKSGADKSDAVYGKNSPKTPLTKLRDSSTGPSEKDKTGSPSTGGGAASEKTKTAAGGKSRRVKKRKIKMSQNAVIDLDPGRKSDRAEVAILHADIIHNARNAFHFELNWLGVTAGLLDDLRTKCAAQAERYGLRFVEAPVEQIKDVSLKCAYRSPISIPLAIPPPDIPDLHLRLAEQGHGTGQSSNFFEYSILTRKFGFVLDVEAGDRYPDNVEVEYSYRGNKPFDHSQFIHRSGLALVQCLGGTDGFIWCDNRLFIAAPTRGRGGLQGSTENYPGAPVPAKLTKQEEARGLRVELEDFCRDPVALKAFYEEITPPPLASASVSTSTGESEDGPSESNVQEKSDAVGPSEDAPGGSGVHTPHVDTETSAGSRPDRVARAVVEDHGEALKSEALSVDEAKRQQDNVASTPESRSRSSTVVNGNGQRGRDVSGDIDIPNEKVSTPVTSTKLLNDPPPGTVAGKGTESQTKTTEGDGSTERRGSIALITPPEQEAGAVGQGVVGAHPKPKPINGGESAVRVNEIDQEKDKEREKDREREERLAEARAELDISSVMQD